MTGQAAAACLAGAVTLALATVGAAQTENESYVAFLAGSWHVGNDDLNNITPGITFGQRGGWAKAGHEWHVEGGVFFNSYREVSPLLLAGLSTDMGALGSGRLRAGLSVGTAYYRELSHTLKDRYNIPNVAGFIPIVAATAAWRIKAGDIRISVVPPGEDTLAIFNLSLARRF